MTTRAVLYLRQSKTDDEGIERQRERTTALAEARKWVVVGEYVDNDVTASKPRGPKTAWGKMLGSAGAYDVVVGVDLDRVVRGTRDINTLIDHQLMLATVDGEIDLTTADGEFRASMLASIARFEVRRKGERQRRANAQRAANGTPPKGVRLTGYNPDFTVNEAEAVVVRRIFDDFLHSESLYGITKALNSEGVPARGARWTTSTIATMLKNPKYCGRIIYQGVLQERRGNWKPLVTEDDFDAVQAIFADPRRIKNREGTARKHIGAGIYRCDSCFKPVTSAARTYSCVSCGMYRTIPHVDGRVMDFIAEVLRIPEVAPLIAPPVSEKGKELAEEAKRLNSRLAVIEADYDAGDIDGKRYKVASDKVRAELEAVDRLRFEQMGSNTLSAVLSAQNPAQAFLDASLETKRVIIDSLVIVRIKKAMRGRKGFDPRSVPVYFKNYVAKADGTANPTIPAETWRAFQRMMEQAA